MNKHTKGLSLVREDGELVMREDRKEELTPSVGRHLFHFVPTTGKSLHLILIDAKTEAWRQQVNCSEFAQVIT